jgi:hypothetical protein
MSFQATPLTPLELNDERLHSTFALDTLTDVARKLSPGAFIEAMQTVFGDDIPPAACLTLRKRLLAGELENPSLRLVDGLGYAADYDNRERIIRVDWEFYLRTRHSAGTSWLLDALFHEFGHHIDNLLRNDLSDRNAGGKPAPAPDATGEEGLRFSCWLAGAAEFAYDEVEIACGFSGYDDTTRTLSLQWSQAAADIQARYQDIKNAPDSGHAHPDREAFEAGDGDSHHQTHLQIEKVLVDLAFSENERDAVYFGNWLRDYSQLLDPKIVRATNMPKNFPDVLSRDALTRIVDVLSVKRFKSIRAHAPEHFTVTPQILGVYRPSEHIDNPKVTDVNAADPRRRDADFEPLVFEGDPLLKVDYESSMKRYIERSVAFMQSELEYSMKENCSAPGMRAFGSALHVLEDFFAHSNFVELSLIKNGYSAVLPWTSAADCKAGLPLVTGMFGPTDVLASIAGPLGEILFSTEDVTYMPVKRGDRSPREQVLLILLEEHHNPRYLEIFSGYLRTRDEWVDLPFAEFLQRSALYLKGPASVVGNASGIIMKDMLAFLGEHVDDWQTRYGQDPHLNGSTDPTHSQLAKDHAEHPLHLLAASLASDAVEQVAKAMVSHWNGEAGADPVAVATSYFKHPQDCDWQDAKVLAWAENNPADLRRSESKQELENVARNIARSGRKALDQMENDSRAYLKFLRGEFLDRNSPFWFIQSLSPAGSLSQAVLKHLGII